MAEKIQRIPTGLLSQFGIVGSGRNVDELSDVVSAVTDIRPNLLARLLESDSASVTGAPLTAATVATVTVPQSEAWAIVAVSASIASAVGVGDDIMCSVMCQPAAGGVAVRIGVAPLATVTAVVDNTRVGLFVPTPIVLAPGSRISARSEIATVGNASLFCHVLFHRLAAV